MAAEVFHVIRALVFSSASAILLLACGDTTGNASCIGVAVQHDTGTCLTTFSRCDDERSYEIACSAGKCTCSVDSKIVSSSKATDCADDPAGVNVACGWDLH